MIYQPRNVQPSGVSIDGLLDNTFTMEIQTNSYVSAYQLLIVDFDNNEIYTGSKTTLTNYAYNGDTLEIPVNASTVALSNGTNYKWRVRLYQPTADMLITYGLVQATSTTTTIYLQPNINIKAGMAITINSQTKTISSYNSDTGVAVVSSAFSSAPAVGTQYKIYSDFIETVPDYIVYARRTPAVAISNVPSSLTLKYHTFQGTYTQSDNVAIVYHQFDLYTRNDDGTISLVASSDKVYSANLSYTYDSFRTGNKYLIQMTVENDMGIISTTDMYEFTVSYDIVEYLQQPLASFDDKNNAVKVSWVTPVENEATSFRSDAATGIIQDNNNTLTQATFEPGQSIGEGDVVQITNSDCELVVDGKSTQETRSGKNLFNYEDIAKIANGVTINKDGWITATLDNSTGTSEKYLQYYTNNLNILTNTTYCAVIEIKTVSGGGRLHPISKTDSEGQFPDGTNYQFSNLQAGDIKIQKPTSRESFDGITYGLRTVIAFPAGASGEITFRISILQDVSTTVSTFKYEPYGVSPSPDYPSEIESVGYENLFDKDNANILNAYLGSSSISASSSARVIYIPCYPNTTYTIQKVVGNAFSIAYTENTPDIGVSIVGRINNKSSSNLTITTGANAKYLVSQIMDSGDTLTEEEILNSIQIEEGSIAHPYVPYSKYGIEVKTVGKNIFDGSRVSVYFYASGEFGTSAKSLTTKNIVAKAGDTFTISSSDYTDGLVIASFDVNNVLLERSALRGTLLTYTCPENTSYIVASNVLGQEQNTTLVKGLKESLDSTEYEPYKENISVLQLNAPLKSLPNGVKDIAYIKDNKLYVDRCVGRIVLDGTESIWTKVNEGFYTPTHSWGNKSKAATLSNYFQTFTKYNGGFQQATNGAGFLYENVYHYYLKIDGITTVEELKTWLSNNNVQVDYELATPVTEELGSSAIPYIDGVNYMHISSNMDTMFSLVYPHKTITGNTYDYTEFNPPGVKQTGTIKSYNAITGIGTLMPQYPFMYTPMQGDSYAVISNIYNVSGFSYLYNTPYNTVNSLYTHGYTATWATPDGLCVLPDDFNITLQFSPDGNFFYDQNGVYQEVVDLITTETDGASGDGEFTIKIDKNKLIFVQNPDISLELPFYTNTTQVFVLSSASVAQLNNDYVWDDTATWTDTYTWVEGGTSLERVCNHWWKVQITNTGIKIEEIFPTT